MRFIKFLLTLFCTSKTFLYLIQTKIFLYLNFVFFFGKVQFSDRTRKNIVRAKNYFVRAKLPNTAKSAREKYNYAWQNLRVLNF